VLGLFVPTPEMLFHWEEQIPLTKNPHFETSMTTKHPQLTFSACAVQYKFLIKYESSRHFRWACLPNKGSQQKYATPKTRRVYKK
jgi:hypothetical protein